MRAGRHGHTPRVMGRFMLMVRVRFSSVKLRVRVRMRNEGKGKGKDCVLCADTATKQVSFDALVRYAASSPAVPREVGILMAAFTAAVLSTLASQPGDAILSEVRNGR